MTEFPDLLAKRFHEFKTDEFRDSAERYRHLAEHGQSPDVMLISCCDSRVDPEAIFSAKPGDLFIVRNVANLVPPFETDGRYHGVSAALEFAVLNLHVKHIVIMGHASCGGIKAAVDQNAAKQTDAAFISNWISMLDNTKLSVMAAHQDSDAQTIADALELAAIKTSLANLRTFPFIQELENTDKLSLHGCHFAIATGDLSVLNETTGEFQTL
ncbi:MAG: carbonic anhydrase [Alphaproteobacteria bacterium]|nr:carbonic anhydrase [Alphaproteobacteria bacterium]